MDTIEFSNPDKMQEIAEGYFLQGYNCCQSVLLAYSDYLGISKEEGFNWGLIRGGMGSVSKLFVAQMQDFLGLGKYNRINIPGTSSGNWQWRMLPGEATPELAEKIRKMTRRYGR